MKPKIVTVGDVSYAVLGANGHPVYVHQDGSEKEFDAAGTMSRIGGLNREAQQNREAKEALEARLKAFEGIEDPAAALQALTTVGNLQSGDLKTASQVEEIKNAARKAAEEQVAAQARQTATKLQELEKERDSFRDSLYNEKVGGAFARSKFITDKTTVPPDMLQAMFGKNFKIENGEIVPYDSNGNKIYSTVRGGELASFEEGLETLINGYGGKGAILKGTNHSGTGAPQTNGGAVPPGGKPQISRQQFESMPHEKRAETVRTHTIVDSAA